jgi:hypothetical protein
MQQAKNGPVRINIYVHDAGVRREIKAMAARKELSVSEYCLRAITEQLAREAGAGGRGAILKTAVQRARRFQARTFGGAAFVVGSDELIERSRKDRAGG